MIECLECRALRCRPHLTVICAWGPTNMLVATIIYRSAATTINSHAAKYRTRMCSGAISWPSPATFSELASLKMEICTCSSTFLLALLLTFSVQGLAVGKLMSVGKIVEHTLHHLVARVRLAGTRYVILEQQQEVCIDVINDDYNPQTAIDFTVTYMYGKLSALLCIKPIIFGRYCIIRNKW